jgi:hypothetical protein
LATSKMSFDLGHRRDPNGADNFPSLKSTFNFARRARPTAQNVAVEEEIRVGSSTNLARRESKGGLRGMFTRTKATVDSNQAMAQLAEDLIYEKNMPETAIPAHDQKYLEPEIPLKKMPFYMRAQARPTPAQAQSLPFEKPARMAVRTKSTVGPKTPTKPATNSPARTPRRTDAAWDPPPLFQAYPQAIKYAQLSASTLSADTILRISNQKAALAQDITPATGTSEEQQVAAARKNEKVRSKHRRQISGSISKADWTQKIFVLVTSGYLLQYSGEGSFDRLPEKMMQLGKDSVAFASDVIPGKHWVLQISQAMDLDGIPAPDARSLLSRLTFRGADYRRAATSLLLVLNSAEDLESWISTVRREIEAMGGKKSVSETGKPKNDDDGMQLKSQPSQRLMVARNPDRFSNPPIPLAQSFPQQWDGQTEDDRAPSMATDTFFQPMGISARDSMSIRTSETSPDGQQLDSLRDSTYRYSYVSSGQRTVITSQGSSPEPSPTRDTFLPMERPVSTGFYLEEARPRPNATAISERRRSMQTFNHHNFDMHTVSKPSRSRPHSTYTGPRATQISSPITTNYSAPHAVKKRHSLTKVPDNTPQAPATTVHNPGRKQEMFVKGNRKSPPTPLISRPLSPVEDQPSPVRSPPAYKPQESSFKTAKHSPPRIVHVPSLPHNASARRVSSLPSEVLQNRPSSRATLSSLETEHNGFRSPRRYSSMQRLPSPSVDTEDFPMKLTMQNPPTPREIPLPASPLPSMSPELRIPFSKYSEATSPTPRVRRPASVQVLSGHRSPGTFNPMVHTDEGLREHLRSANGFPISKSTAGSSMLQFTPTSRFSLLKPAVISPTSAQHPVQSPRLLNQSSSGFLSPSFQHIKDGSDAKSLLNRRSMPHLVNGPPPAPPPNCALPPLPPGTPPAAGLRSPLGVRGSMNLKEGMNVTGMI